MNNSPNCGIRDKNDAHADTIAALIPLQKLCKHTDAPRLNKSQKPKLGIRIDAVNF